MSRGSCSVKFGQVPTNVMHSLLFKKNIYTESKTSRRVAITCIILYKLSQMLLEIIHVLFFQYAIINFLALEFSVFLKSEIISYFGILQFTQKCRAKEMRLYKKQPQNSHQDI